MKLHNSCIAKCYLQEFFDLKMNYYRDHNNKEASLYICIYIYIYIYIYYVVYNTIYTCISENECLVTIHQLRLAIS